MYYELYADGCAMQSKVAFDTEDPFLGRIRADSVAPPHSPTSIKRCISRAERNPILAYAADFFVDTSCETPLKEGHICLCTDGPGLSSDEPMAIVLKSIPGPDGRYFIKNRAADIFWNASHNPIRTVRFDLIEFDLVEQVVESAQKYRNMQVNEHSIIQVFRG